MSAASRARQRARRAPSPVPFWAADIQDAKLASASYPIELRARAFFGLLRQQTLELMASPEAAEPGESSQALALATLFLHLAMSGKVSVTLADDELALNMYTANAVCSAEILRRKGLIEFEFIYPTEPFKGNEIRVFPGGAL